MTAALGLSAAASVVWSFARGATMQRYSMRLRVARKRARIVDRCGGCPG